jgi:hypothetical protein
VEQRGLVMSQSRLCGTVTCAVLGLGSLAHAEDAEDKSVTLVKKMGGTAHFASV